MSVTNVEEILEDVIQRFVVRRKYGVCLVASALLRHRLGGVGDVIQGYLILDSHHCYFRHYWYRLDGKDYDVGTSISTRLNIAHPPLRLCETMPSGSYNYVSAFNQAELKAVEKGYQMYLTKQKTFWKSWQMNWLKKLVL